MTNNWADIGNSTCVVVMGANPAENHPASMAHINRARSAAGHRLPGGGISSKRPAKLIVIDPRKTPTALQADLYVRIRPGTNQAFINGLVRQIIAQMEGGGVDANVTANFFGFLNQSGNGTFYTDGDATTPSTSTTVPGNSKYTDARFIVRTSDGQDYDRETIVAATGLPAVGGEPADTVISSFPKKAASVTADPNTVYNKLKAHVAPYTLAEVANICGCSEAEVAAVAAAYIDNSRCSSFNAATPTTIDHDPTTADFRSTTMMYAMGLTQFTSGSQNVNSFSTLQSLLGNAGRAGGGINALRGIHNVQGSTDMGLLYHLIPGYSGNPGAALQPAVDANGFGKYMDPLWGIPLSGTGTRATMNDSYDDAYINAAMGLQQRGFYNMTLTWFGDYALIDSLSGAAKRAAVDAAFSLWPKNNGWHHIKIFREMAAGTIKAAVVWGQNPAVTEPNQGFIRRGLKNLDLLVVTDMFDTETSACDRKAGSVTYLLPAASHVEKAGAAANSGRVLQWRYQSIPPMGNSKDDMELLLRLAKAFADVGAFNHLELGAGVNGIAAGQAYAKLYGSQYGYTPGVDTYATVSGTAEMATVGPNVSTPTTYASTTVTGSEWVNELVYRQLATPPASGGTLWIYTGGYDASSRATNLHAAKPGGVAQPNWETDNRAKSRSRLDGNNTLAFPGWGYAWLVNRRVLYNNAELPGDIGDFFMGPDSCARLFTSNSSLKGRTLNYSRWYRFYHTLADKPVLPDGVTLPAVHVLPGRFNSHTEPYETPREDLAAVYGYNSNATNAHGGVAGKNLVMAGTQVGTVSQFPLIMTTIRCVEHFQGGPITRNNAWNVELEPEPWIELNSLDARAKGIVDGDMVRVVTARTQGLPANGIETEFPRALYGQGFRARVGVGLESNQRVAKGVIAIPWHWGDRGLSTGSRANDIGIDAFDANTTIPESKVCLCRIEKI
jgi:formate dehydrogenase major subunit